MENKRLHLEMIQGVINRMAGNLFYLKGWVITLIAALFVLSNKDSDRRYLIIAYFPVFIFWLLDGYFLSHERLFRALYDDVRKRDEDHIDFSMDVSSYKDEKNGWLQSIFSTTLCFFYFPLVGMMLAVMWILRS